MNAEIEIHSCAEEQSIMSFPMGSLCIKTAINTSDLPKSALFEHVLADDPVEEAKNVLKRNPRVVLLSVYIWNAVWMEVFAEEIKKNNSKIVIGAGGPQASAFRQDMPKCFDYAVSGEGESAQVNALRDIFCGKRVEGLIQGKAEDLSALESPFLSGNCNSSLEKNDCVLWEMSRGCPFACAFCFESRGNRNVRNYPFERIEKELEFLVDRDVRNVFVLDPTFNLNGDRAKRILRLLIENAPASMHFTFEIRAELLDEEMANLFAELNCSLQIGLQSSNVDVLKGINRSFEPEKFIQKVKLLNKSGAAFGFDIIIGLPGDTLASFRETVNFAVSLQPSNIDCFVLSLLPGTELAQNATALGLVVDSGADSGGLKTVVSSPTFSSEDIQSAVEIRSSLDLFYTKGQACMWMHCVLETLNISACNLFSLFSKWMKQTSRSSDEDVWILQDDFITSLFEKTQNGKLLPAMKSFMELHQGLSYVTDTGEDAELELSYRPDDLAKLDTMSLKEFVKTHKVFYCNPTVSLDENGMIIIIN